MKTISKYLLIPIFLFTALTTFSQENGDAIFNKVIHEYTLNEDGSSEYREYKELKLLSHLAFHRYFGETFIVYDPTYQEVEINEAYTLMADGKRVEVPDNAFNEVLPRAAAHSAPYNHLREMVITHTGLEVGASIFLDYTIKTKDGYMPAFMGEELIKGVVPIKDKKVIFHIPEGMELQYKMLNMRTSPEITAAKGGNIYTFSFTALSAHSNYWGTDSELLPRLFFSTAKDLPRAYFPFVAQAAFTYQTTPAMGEAIEKIKAENKGDLKTAHAIQNMVINEIGSWRLSLKHTAFKCRTPEEVWKSNAGTKLEKTVLLASLLQKAGLRAVPVAIIPEKYFDRKVGSLYIFKDFAVQLKTDNGKAIYLSATHKQSNDMAYELDGQKMLILDGAIESLRTFDPINISPEIIYQGKFVNDDNEKIKGELNIKLVGSANPYFNLLLDTAYAKQYAKGVQDVELRMLNENESAFKLEIVQEDIFDIYGNYFFMDLPSSPKGISSWRFPYVESGRQEPIKLKELISEKYYYSIEFPDGFELVSPAVDISIENAIGHLRISLRQEGNIVLTNREIKLHQDLVRYSDFDAFNELWKAWMNPGLHKIILKKEE